MKHLNKFFKDMPAKGQDDAPRSPYKCWPSLKNPLTVKYIILGTELRQHHNYTELTAIQSMGGEL